MTAHFRTLISILLLLGLGPAPHPAAAVAATVSIEELPSWQLAVGQTRTLSIERLERYFSSGKSVRVARMPAPSPPGTLILKAHEPGLSELWVWQKEGPTLHLNLDVKARAPRETEGSGKSLEQDLELLRETAVTQAGDRVALRGRISSETELARIRLLEEAFPKRIENQTELAAELMASGRKRLSDWIINQKLQSFLRVEALGGQLWVRGSAPDAAARASWEQALLAVFPGVRLDISSLPDSSRTLFFRVFLLEMKKSAFRQLGLDWPSRISGILQVEGGTLFWAKAPQIELSLKWLEGKGWAKVLSQPELVVRVPGEAELFTGGEIPLELHSKAAHRSGSWLEWKPYGLLLRLKTLHSTAEQVRLEITSEISELDRANGSESIPALQASRLKTQVDARIGEPLFLSGLLQEQSGTQKRGLPVLRSLPVLGSLFGSEDFINRRSELVAVLVPLNSPPPAPSWSRPSEHSPLISKATATDAPPRAPSHRENWFSPYSARNFR